MGKMVFEITEEDADGGCIARALGHSSVTEPASREQLRAHVSEVVLCHFDEGKAAVVILANQPVAA